MSNTESLSIEVDFSVRDGMAAAVQGIGEQMLAHAASAQGLAFEPRLSADGSQFSIRTSASAEAAIQQLLLRIGPDLTQLDGCARVTRLACTGAVSQALRSTLTRFNASFH